MFQLSIFPPGQVKELVHALDRIYFHPKSGSLVRYFPPTPTDAGSDADLPLHMRGKFRFTECYINTGVTFQDVTQDFTRASGDEGAAEATAKDVPVNINWAYATESTAALVADILRQHLSGMKVVVLPGQAPATMPFPTSAVSLDIVVTQDRTTSRHNAGLIALEISGSIQEQQGSQFIYDSGPVVANIVVEILRAVSVSV